MAEGRHPSFQPEENRRQLQRRLNSIPGITITDDRLAKSPVFSVSVIAAPDTRRSFFSTMEWALTEMTKA